MCDFDLFNSNVGDFIINAELIKAIAMRTRIDVYTIGPKKINFHFENNNLSQFNFASRSKAWIAVYKSILRQKSHSDDVYYLMQPGHRENSQSLVNLLSRTMLLMILKLLGTKIISLGASTSIKSNKQKMFAKIFSRITNLQTLRDSDSIAQLKLLGVSTQYFPDWSWNLPQLQTVPALATPYKTLASFRDYNPKMSQQIIELEQTHPLKLKLFHQVSNDTSGMDILASSLSQSGIKYDLTEKRIDSKSLESVYRDQHFVISNRLHVLLIAASYNVIPIFCGDPDKRNKIIGTYDDLELGNLIANFHEPGSLINAMNYAISNQSNILAKIKNHRLKSQKVVYAQLDKLIQ